MVKFEFMSRYANEPLDTVALRLPLGESEVKAEIRRHHHPLPRRSRSPRLVLPQPQEGGR